ncbi:hypothetical protein L0222_01520 [bacterium]|nr:hypothetical protein [bacterium]
MNPLELLKKSDSRLYAEFVKALTKDLGLNAGSLQCPNCKAQFKVLFESESGAGKKSRKKKMPKPARGSLFQLLVDLARLRNTTTGTINRQFKQTQKPSKKLSVQEMKQLKIAWVKQEIEKAKKVA